MRKVIKVGSSSLFNGGPRTEVFDDIARQVSDLRKAGHEIAVVSSAAIAFGRKQLGLPRGAHEDLHTKQALASLGQPLLMAQWARAFQKQQVSVGQALLTRQEMAAGSGQMVPLINGTFNRLFDLGIVPIVNENDTVASDEIKFGDNDQLAASVAKLVGARTLHLLGTTEALYSDFPVNNLPIADVELGQLAEYESLAFDSADPQATGGMVTKLAAARIFVGDNREMFIGPANNPDAIGLLETGQIGTRFFAAK